MLDIRNRLEKKNQKLSAWALKANIQAYRIYDHDIPEYPFYLDRYGDYLVFYDRSRPDFARDAEHVQTGIRAIQDLFRPQPKSLIFKSRKPQEGKSQYQKLGQQNKSFLVHEGDLKFEVNLWDYLDSGLFLDHRPLRSWVRQSSASRVLNLFCYTGSLSVAAAKAGAVVTSIDMNANYLDWAQRNFQHNSLDPLDHRFFRLDLMSYLQGPPKDTYDLILLDPPTFSNSKKMSQTLDIQRDHVSLIQSCMRRLNPGGTLYFSNNKRKFRLDPSLHQQFKITEVTEDSIPVDFQNRQIHCCFKIQ